MEPVKCPKCSLGRMVPLSGTISARTGDVQVMQYAEWRCVDCGYSVTAPRTNTI